MNSKRQRIWELDAIRGLCLFGMIVVHFLYDLSYFAGIRLSLPQWCYFVRDYGHVLFIMISGICVTLASSSFRRGVVVFGAGLLISYITLFMDFFLGMADLRIWFGILHMLGVCMMVYPIFRRLPWWALGIIGTGFIFLGFWMLSITVPVDFLFPFGLCSNRVFTGSDYVPLFPGLGWFLIGACLGKTVYRNQKSLLPKATAQNPILNFLQTCGMHSLEIYLLHQPVLLMITLVIFILL